MGAYWVVMRAHSSSLSSASDFDDSYLYFLKKKNPTPKTAPDIAANFRIQLTVSVLILVPSELNPNKMNPTKKVVPAEQIKIITIAQTTSCHSGLSISRSGPL